MNEHLLNDGKKLLLEGFEKNGIYNRCKNNIRKNNTRKN